MFREQTTSFYWHDYETWGTDPRKDRIAQFAGIRTDLDFNIIDEQPLVSYCRPAFDMLPQPEACLVTGISPQTAFAEGMREAELFAAIHAEMIRPGTCSLGYNSIRFDDHFTRYGFYRNFFDPYAREWQNGNSRWDIIDMLRLMHALRPEGLEWPRNEQGVTSFRLEDLTAVNAIAHAGAHDALADVRATIELAKRIKQAQPKLFDYVFAHRHKSRLMPMVDPTRPKRLVHVSEKYPAHLGCIAVVWPLVRHPRNPNGIIVYDLRADPRALIDRPVEQLRHDLYTPTRERPEGASRPALKVMHLNHAPVVAPLSTLTPQARVKWDLDEERERRHLAMLMAIQDLPQKVAQIFTDPIAEVNTVQDPDQRLYDGFLSEHDRQLCEQVRRTPPEHLGGLDLPFEDGKLHELLFRYRARNWPEYLNPEEQVRWTAYRRSRLFDPEGGGSIQIPTYRKQVARLIIEQPQKRALLDDLLAWVDRLEAEFD